MLFPTNDVGADDVLPRGTILPPPMETPSDAWPTIRPMGRVAPHDLGKRPYTHAIPVGIDSTGKALFHDARRLPYLPVLAQDADALDSYLCGLCEYLELQDLSFAVLDDGHLLTHAQDERVLQTSEKVHDFLEGLPPNPTQVEYLILTSWTQTMRKCSEQDRKILRSFVLDERSAGLTVVIAASELWRFVQADDSELRRFFSNLPSGLWLGHSFDKAPFFTRYTAMGTIDHQQTLVADRTTGFLATHGTTNVARVLEPTEPVIEEASQDEHDGMSPRMHEVLVQGSVVGGRYEAVTLVGKSVQSEVWLVRDLRLGAQWALKYWRKPNAFGMTAFHERDIREEGLVLSGLSHPAIPRVVDMIDGEQSVYLITDCVKGQNLDCLLSDAGPLDQRFCVRVAIELCDVLSYLHGRDEPIIHGDLKPANMVWRSTGGVALLDYSQAKRVGATTRRPAVTPGYAQRPSDWPNVAPDTQDDIYGLGMTIHALVCGKRPEPWSEPQPLRLLRPDTARGLEHVVMRATAKDKRNRYRRIEEMLDDLLACGVTEWERAEPPRGTTNVFSPFFDTIPTIIFQDLL